ncbi:MAG: transglycosylase domain-containing protein [Candidatus Wildermuthbacteria bacterium]|nr:transglycosylase domain-containing protein [Candidatus Wildermuthbacteria bacterium]
MKKYAMPWARLLNIALVCVGGVLIAGTGAFVYFSRDLPVPEKFSEMNYIQPTRIYERTGTVVLYEIYGNQRRQVVSLSEIPLIAQQAVIATEDARFYAHFGIDWRGVLRAILANVKTGGATQGGSTISQQLVRNSLLTQKKTVSRKIQEAILTLQLERTYSKSQILGFYLNQIPFGPTLYGIAAASQEYFGKEPKDMTIAESALLAALIKAPGYYYPFGTHRQELMARKDYVLSRMEKVGYISSEQKEEAQKELITLQKPLRSMRAPHFVLGIMDYLYDTYGEKFLQENGLRVITTLDWTLQTFAEEAVRNNAERNESLGAYNEALVAIDPSTGEILAMVGSKDWDGSPYPDGCVSGKNCLFDPKLNVATYGIGRQPGSAFKPFAYATAFKKGYDDTTIVVDEETNFGVWGDAEYIPKNYDGTFRGPVTLRQALAQSLNIPSIKVLLDFAGIQDSVQTATDMGISALSSDLSRYGPSLVLGGGEVRLQDIVSAYGVFASRGVRVPPFSSSSVFHSCDQRQLAESCGRKPPHPPYRAGAPGNRHHHEHSF